MPGPMWTPPAGRVAAANATAFISAVNHRHQAGLSDFRSLYEWSIGHPQEFWPEVWSFCSVAAGRRWESVLIDGDRMPGALWFDGARLNFAENLLRFRDQRPAVVFWNEAGHQRSLTYSQLHDEVRRLAAWLKSAGIRPGDRVAGWLPNMPEALVAMLAAASLGAMWTSTSPDFGVEGVVDRFGQISPKVLVAADGCIYQGRTFDMLPRLGQIVERIGSIERVLVVPYTRPDPPLSGIRQALLLGQALDEAGGGPLEFAQLPFDHPLYILYSSGTTGRPKCIVHGAGGTLLQHLKELVLHTDLKRDDVIFYFTTTGWMMWNWLASSLAVGATVVLYDGSPFHPSPARLFDMADAERITVLGTSARYLSAIQKEGLLPRRSHDLAALRTILSTGSPLAPESFDYVYQQVKPDVSLSSISGGTDLISCFALGNPIGPVYRGELQTRGLGMKVEVYNEQGHSVRGERGELVCTAPFPSMPIGFWNDPDGAKYQAAYFEHFPGVWRHGDYVELTEHDGMIFHGRSDAVLNPGGVRIGTSEIYRQVEKLAEVLESVAVAQRWQGDVRVVLFVKLRPGLALDEPLKSRINEQIRAGASPRHVPAKIVAVADVPRTKSGKTVELAVRDMIHGLPIRNREALANPESLQYFVGLPELDT
ncbi:MAG: acetoacetate--CoA ligase [Pirellulales bacterium]